MKRYLETVISKEEQEKIIADLIDLPKKIASKYRHLMDFDELVSYGSVGLVEGAQRFNPEGGASAKTYVSLWIRGRMLEAIYKNRNVHIPFNKINQNIAQKENPDEDLPTFEIPPEISLNKYDGSGANDHSASARDKIEFQYLNSSLSGTVEAHEEREMKEHVEHMLTNSSLSSIEEQTIVHRFGLRGEDPKTLQEVAEITEYTIMGIQKAEKRALKKLNESSAFTEVFAS